ncbi:hypothetical protein EPICR_100048 [Candidatus Desulfarcum epimagneticum]|uniref:Uncharacterized protein n=1 Tax=uncultured Desulfobacteraceae bacterium TaxID=218296 RepID=A0A484HCK9_9BACT|nr:hypothetical protein EPICR_100048 [uncultured Desulfobacteraceae bacterium]
MNQTDIDEMLRSEFVLLFTGNFYPGFREPTQLIHALKALPEIKLIIIGDTSRFNWLFFGVCPQIKLLGVTDHAKCRRLQKQATMLVNIGNRQSYQTPGKLFEYFGAQRPVFHIAGRPDDDISLLLNKLNRGISVYNQSDQIAEALEIAYADWRKGALDQKFNLSLDTVKDYSWSANANCLYKKIKMLEKNE